MLRIMQMVYLGWLFDSRRLDDWAMWYLLLWISGFRSGVFVLPMSGSAPIGETVGSQLDYADTLRISKLSMQQTTQTSSI